MRLYIKVLLLLMACSWSAGVSAQLLKRRGADSTERPPSAVLVQLFTGERRLERSAIASWNRAFREDMKIVNSKIIMDFEDNFTYCPVYYFYEANYKAIIAGELAGNLMDAKGNVLTTNPLAGDSSYFILRYQNLVATADDTYDAPVTRRLLLAETYKGHLLPAPQPRTTGSVPLKKHKMKKDRKEYRYISKITDMYYRPKALKYSVTLEAYYGNLEK